MVAVAVAVGGCGGTERPPGPPRELERTTLRVGALPVVDSAPLYIALRKGYFAAEGLTVMPHPMQSSEPAPGRLARGELDISYVNYTSLFAAPGAATGRFRVLVEGYQGKPGVLGVVSADEKVGEPRDLVGKKIAVNVTNALGRATVDAALKANEVESDLVEYVPVPFPKMVDALARREVAAAWMSEPFIAEAARKLGARLVLDAVRGATDDLPVGGYASTRAFSETHPRTVAAFLRALHRGQRAAADRGVLEEAVPAFTGVDSESAVISGVGVFPTAERPSPVRLQRVADLMRQFGLLRGRLDVTALTRA
jgi:NitT/TauT family transport system substrate-binding protein